MALGPKLEIKQSTALAMTPALRQAIDLLQLPAIELAAFLNEEAQRNPLLLLEDDQAESGEPVTAKTREEIDALERKRQAWLAWQNTEFSHAFRPPPEGYTSAAAGPLGSSTGRDEGDAGGLENIAATPDLHTHIMHELPLVLRERSQRAIAELLIRSLDEAGYLSEGIDVIARRHGIAETDVKVVLRDLQKIEPAGLFATSLQECLRLQLEAQGSMSEAMARLLENLPLLAKHDYETLARQCGVERRQLFAMIDELRGLNPKPGAQFQSPQNETIVPDLIVDKDRRGRWQVTINNAFMPRIGINAAYRDELKNTVETRRDKDFLLSSLSSANAVMTALHRRQENLLAVGTELLKRQQRFFDEGMAGLRALNLTEVAQAVSLHESSVSRLAAHKYLACDQGIYALKFFFASGVRIKNSNESHAAEAVIHRIRELIAGETANDVLSDRKITSILRDEGLEIARRTVAKYRARDGIAPSSVRRRVYEKNIYKV